MDEPKKNGKSHVFYEFKRKVGERELKLCFNTIEITAEQSVATLELIESSRHTIPTLIAKLTGPGGSADLRNLKESCFNSAIPTETFLTTLMDFCLNTATCTGTNRHALFSIFIEAATSADLSKEMIQNLEQERSQLPKPQKSLGFNLNKVGQGMIPPEFMPAYDPSLRK